jgi:hypothetical protein
LALNGTRTDWRAVSSNGVLLKREKAFASTDPGLPAARRFATG